MIKGRRIGIFTGCMLASMQAEATAPKRVFCDISYLQTVDEISTVMTDAVEECQAYGCDPVSILLQYSEPAQQVLAEEYFECREHQGRIVTCAALYSDDELAMNYVFNTQNGSLELEDKVTGQRVYSSWGQPYSVDRKSGYISMSTNLQNTKGGLLGKSRVWSVLASCNAKVRDYTE